MTTTMPLSDFNERTHFCRRSRRQWAARRVLVVAAESNPRPQRLGLPKNFAQARGHVGLRRREAHGVER